MYISVHLYSLVHSCSLVLFVQLFLYFVHECTINYITQFKKNLCSFYNSSSLLHADFEFRSFFCYVRVLYISMLWIVWVDYFCCPCVKKMQFLLIFSRRKELWRFHFLTKGWFLKQSKICQAMWKS
mgnify:CR=1 FL=1